MRKVIIESPYAGTNDEIKRNIEYAWEAMRDSFLRGEAPFASHLLYTQEGILDDTNSDERRLGIEAGLVWGREAELTAVYVDLGISNGMKQGIKRAEEEGRSVVFRYMYTPQYTER